LESFILSTVVVAVAEIGDKTQLLALLLASRYPYSGKILSGITVATLANHLLAAWAGDELTLTMSDAVLRPTLAVSFIVLGLWLLRPDAADDAIRPVPGGAFVATTVLFFLAEMGDKTQAATVALGARFDGFVMVAAGTTLGVLAANAPVVLGSGAIMRRIPAAWVRRTAAAVFIVLGILTWAPHLAV